MPWFANKITVILFSVFPGVLNSVYLVLPFIILSQIHQIPAIKAERGFGTDVALLVSSTFASQVQYNVIQLAKLALGLLFSHTNDEMKSSTGDARKIKNKLKRSPDHQRFHFLCQWNQRTIQLIFHFCSPITNQTQLDGRRNVYLSTAYHFRYELRPPGGKFSGFQFY